MPRKTLTATAVQKLKTPKSGRSERFDASLPGFGVRVTSSGARSWIVLYWLGGRRRRYTIGTTNEFDLADARERARDVLKLAAHGVDPLEERQSLRMVTGKTISAAVERYIVEGLSHRSVRGQKEAIRPLRLLAKAWGTRQLSEITRRDISDQRDALKTAGKPYAAERLVVEVRTFFAWAVEKSLTEDTPAGLVKSPFKRGERRSRRRVLSNSELREVWLACDELGYPYGRFVQVLMLTGVRRTEASDMEWKELDREASVWIIPAPRTKTKLEDHLVPLTTPVLKILTALPRFGGPYSFTTTSGRTPISGFSSFKRRLDEIIWVRRIAGAENADQVEPMPSWRHHDLRRSISTNLARLRTDPLIIRLVLGHTTESAHSGIDGTYNKHRYFEEQRRAMELWAGHLLSVVGKKAKKVPANA